MRRKDRGEWNLQRLGGGNSCIPRLSTAGGWGPFWNSGSRSKTMIFFLPAREPLSFPIWPVHVHFCSRVTPTPTHGNLNSQKCTTVQAQFLYSGHEFEGMDYGDVGSDGSSDPLETLHATLALARVDDEYGSLLLPSFLPPPPSRCSSCRRHCLPGAVIPFGGRGGRELDVRRKVTLGRLGREACLVKRTRNKS